MPRPLLLLLLLLLPLLPSAAAAGALDVPLLHVGDRLLYRSVSEERVLGADGTDATDVAARLRWTGEMETLVTVEGRSRAADEYGVDRDAVAFRIERAQDDRIVAVERCHLHPALGLAVRHEYVDGGPRDTNEWPMRDRSSPFGAATRYYNSSPLVAFRAEACEGFWSPGYADFREGERVDIAWHFRGSDSMPRPAFARESLPAQSTTWRGAPALEYVFVYNASLEGSFAAEGRARLVFASGFPGPVLVDVVDRYASGGTTWTASGTRELVGYRGGLEPFPYDLPYYEDPMRSPLARFAPQDRLTVPDAALGLAYPFAEALASMRADRALGLAEYLAARPDAGLVHGAYEARAESPAARQGPRIPAAAATDTAGPGWTACFADAESDFCARSVRPRGMPVALQERAPSWDTRATFDAPLVAPTPEDLARLAQSVGIARGTVASLSYDVSAVAGIEPVAQLTLAQVSYAEIAADGDGVIATLDVSRGAVLAAHAASVRTAQAGLLSAAAPPRTLVPAAASADWEDLRFGALGVAAAAAVGVGVLALVVKLFLLPLFTRLRRDRLLDNPVRARLYDRVRQDPGAHLAELEEFLGIGKGATRHHVDQLARHRLLFLVEESGYTRAYVAGHVPLDVARRSAILRAGSHQAVYEHYAARPDASLREAARALGMSAPSVHRAKRKLESAGLLPAPPRTVDATLR